ncbi:hypothetical protein KOW79_022393 [Hemibagrus wyckioides]|uniref:Melatonin receptor 1a n=1 Tax=Hemibagrus wyckioides TaxID=337641 RepID=A0A9D3S7X1_9TELE|nr:hypothetical protein KOW79_022393 [Hemibagrus wyckioides]
MPAVERLAMLLNGSQMNGSTTGEHALHRPPWVTTTLGCFLIFTIVVDILGNLLVIFSVYRNKKLRNAVGDISGVQTTSDFVTCARLEIVWTLLEFQGGL